MEIDYDVLATKIVERQRENDEREHPRCQCPAGNDRHYKHHQFLDAVISFFDRLDGIKWGVIRAVAVWLTVGSIIIVLIGLVIGTTFKIRSIVPGG